jgi:3-methyladenine DNA glycosylase AlkD
VGAGCRPLAAADRGDLPDRAKDRVDTALLAEAIEANVDDPDFFLRKGIGWALRQHARLDPEWVRGFAATHALSPLSRREALKHLEDRPGSPGR